MKLTEESSFINILTLQGLVYEKPFSFLVTYYNSEIIGASIFSLRKNHFYKWSQKSVIKILIANFRTPCI